MPATPPIARPPGSAPRGVDLILDHRRGRPWRHGLPQRLITAGAWGGTAWLLGPLALKGLLVAGLGGALGLPLLERHLAQRSAAAGLGVSAAPPPPGELPRQQLAEAFGLPEVELFRARHARICRVEHDGEGRIRAISLPGPCLSLAHPHRDAHPVG